MQTTPILFIIPGACSFGSMVTLEWLKIPYQIGITTPEIRASKKFLAINPTGKVGALKDGNLVVAENLAILLYLADKYPEKNVVAPINTLERVKIYQWLSYLSSTLHPAFSQVLYADRFVAAQYQDDFRQLAYTRLFGVLSHVNQHLSQHKHFVGDKPDIVDAQAYGLLRWSNLHKHGTSVVDLSQYPSIVNFLSHMEQIIEVKNALAIEQQQTDKLINSQFNGYFSF